MVEENKKKKLVVFDFDGTLTQRDTLLPLAFWFFKNGYIKSYLAFLKAYMLFKLGLMSNAGLKNKFSLLFFKGDIGSIQSVIKSFFEKGIAYNLDVLNDFKRCLDDSDKAIIVSANFDLVINSWLDYMNIDNVDVLATKLKKNNNIYLGGINGVVCRGKEKLLRISGHLDLNNYFIICYADENSDKYIMSIADEQKWVK